MKMHEKILCPINCAYSTGPTSLYTLDSSIYNISSTRSVFIEDPLLSKFKMKSLTQTCLLEPSFFGLKFEDEITVELDALAISGVTTINFELYKLNNDGSATQIGIFSYGKNLSSFYMHYKFNLVLDANFLSCRGVCINLRPSALNSEIIMKNVSVKIKTSNPLFKMNDNFTVYRNKVDFLKLINEISVNAGTIEPAFNGIKTCYTSGVISLPDSDTYKILNGSGTYHGIMARLTQTKYKNPVVVYLEYKNSNANPMNETLYCYDYNNQLIGGTTNYTLDNTLGLWVKKMLYFSTYSELAAYRFVDISRTGLDNDVEFKNIIINDVRYDDYINNI